MYKGILIYGLLFSMSIWSSVKANRTEKKKYLWIIVIAMTIIAGFRGYNVGIDTKNYVNIIELLSQGKMRYAYGIEHQFKILATILLRIINSPTFIFVVCAAIIYGFTVFRLWDFRKIASFPWMLSTFLITNYFLSINVFRQFCAVAIVFYGTRYLAEKKYMKFLVYIIAALLFHNTALLGLVFLALEIIQWNYITKKQRMLLMLMIVALPFVVPLVISKMYSYQHYFVTSSTNIGIMLILKIGLFVCSCIGLKSAISRKNQCIPKNIIVYQVRTVEIYYFIGILLTGLGYFFNHMERVGLSFYIFEAVYFGMIVKNGKYKVIYQLIVGALLLFLVITSLIGNGQGQLPYYFFWQSISG